MSSTSEVGNSKHVANYSTAIQILNEMGTLYNPPARLQIVNLTPIEAQLAPIMVAFNQDFATNKIDGADRETAYKKLDKRITMSNNYFKSLDVDDKDK